MRRVNLLKQGETTITEQTIHEPIELGKMLDRALEQADYAAKKERFARENKSAAR